MNRHWMLLLLVSLCLFATPLAFAEEEMTEEELLRFDLQEGSTEADAAVDREKGMTGRERRLETLDLQAELRLEEIQRQAEGLSTEARLSQPLTLGIGGLTPTERVNQKFKYNDPLRVRWALDLNNRRIINIWMPPAGLDIQFALFNTDQNDLIAIHMHTGKPLWWTRTAAAITGEPYFTKTHVYVTVRDYVTMLERYTGRALWSVRLPFAPSSGTVALEPKEGEPMLYTSGLGRTTYGVEIFREVWPPKGRTRALTRDDFQMEQFTPFVNWWFRTPGIVKSEPVYSQGRLIVGDWEGRIYGINTRKITGRTPNDFWTQRTSGAILTPPLAHKAFLFAPSSDRSILCLSVRDGTRFWRRILTDAVEKRPQYLADLVTRKEFLLCAVGEGKALVALNPENGKPLWQQDGGTGVVALFQDKEKPNNEKMIAVIAQKDGSMVGVPISKPLKISKEKQEANRLADRFATPPTAWKMTLQGFEPFATNSRVPYVITATEDGSVACALEFNKFGQ